MGTNARNARTNKRGFTIVELLIVIVVIAILAAISIVAYQGVQKRTRDSIRMSDVASIKKALLIYKSDNGAYPATAPNPGISTWEVSSDPDFMISLSSYTGGKTWAPPSGRYKYRTFPAGTYGCPASLGPYIALWIEGMENQSTYSPDLGPCPGNTLLTGGYAVPSNYLVLLF